MENEEKEVLVDVSEESETEQSDYFIQENIIGLLERRNQSQKPWSESLILIISCLILFISSTVVLITLPVYIEESNRCGITPYSKIATLATGNLVLFTVFCAAKKCLQRCGHPPEPTSRLYMCLPNVLQTSFISSVGSLSVFWLANEELVSCHLQDPLKGCVVVFALVFYFIFSKTTGRSFLSRQTLAPETLRSSSIPLYLTVLTVFRLLSMAWMYHSLSETSVERVFCTITVIVGTFVTVDFGLCDRFRCRGADVPDPTHHTQYSFPDDSVVRHTLYGLYVVGYMLALATYALHFTCLENYCHSPNYSSSLDVSIVSGESSRGCVPTTHSLSIISGGRGGSRIPPLNVSLVSAPQATSTPNEGPDGNRPWAWDPSDWLAAHHALLAALVALLCWVPTLGLFGKEPSLLVTVAEQAVESFVFHLGGGGCTSLWLPSVVLMTSYVLLCLSALTVLLTARSALTVVCVLMNALPMASLFWSVCQLDRSSPELVTLKMSVTGEAVSAMLGFPIIGVGTFLLIKTHLTPALLHLRLPNCS